MPTPDADLTGTGLAALIDDLVEAAESEATSYLLGSTADDAEAKDRGRKAREALDAALRAAADPREEDHGARAMRERCVSWLEGQAEMCRHIAKTTRENWIGPDNSREENEANRAFARDHDAQAGFYDNAARGVRAIPLDIPAATTGEGAPPIEAGEAPNRSLPGIEFHQHDFMPGFAAFHPGATTVNPDSRAFCAVNLGSFLAAVDQGAVSRADLPYFLAESMMHEVVHVLEQWAGVAFSEERVDALIEQYRAFDNRALDIPAATAGEREEKR